MERKADALSSDNSAFLEELYVARCKDTNEKPTREEFLRFNSRLKSRSGGAICSLRSQHLGVSAASTLSKFLRNRTQLMKLDLYCNLIRDHGLQVISHLLHSNPSIRNFNIGCNDLSDKAGPYLAEIVASGRLRSLQLGTVEKALHPNKLTSLTLDAISEAAVKSNTLLSLGLSGSSLGLRQAPNVPPAEIGLVRLLARSNSLLVLKLAECELSSPMMMTVIDEGLCFNSSLRRLDISENGLNAAVGVRLAEHLTESTKALVVPVDSDGPDCEEIVETEDTPRLFALDVSKNCFNANVAACFARTLKSYPLLGVLDLNGNEVGDEGAVELAKALMENISLVELHLSANHITSVGGVALAQALRRNETLTTLNMGKNKLGDETAFAMAEALTVNSAIMSLNISSAMLSNEGGIKLAQASALCGTLIALDMSDNFFTESAGSAMEKLFKENLTILKIDVRGTQINHFAFHALTEICTRNAAALKQKEQRPLRNQLIKSQYSVVELERKQTILENLIKERDDLQDQIDALDEQIRNLRSDEEMNASMLSKQIQEKEQQMLNDKNDFDEKMKKLEEDLKESEEKKAVTSAALETQLAQIKELRTQTDRKKEELDKIKETFEGEKGEKLKEIEDLGAAADELFALAQDAERLAEMDELPEFLVFEDEKKTGEEGDADGPLSTKRSKAKKSSRGKPKKGSKAKDT